MDKLDIFNQKVAQFIKKKRKELGITQSDVAQKLGIEQATYSGWENGKREISLARYIQLAEILELETPFPKEAELDTEGDFYLKYKKELKQELKQEIKQELLQELKTELWNELLSKLIVAR